MRLSLTENEIQILAEHHPELYTALEGQVPTPSPLGLWMVFEVQNADWLAIQFALDNMEEYPEHE